jgi:hypothetical protein
MKMPYRVGPCGFITSGERNSEDDGAQPCSDVHCVVRIFSWPISLRQFVFGKKKFRKIE